MTFDADIKAGLADALAEAGELATFRPVSGSPVACLVVVRQEAVEEPVGFASRVSQLENTLEADPDELGQVPASGDEFETASRVWTVTPRILENSGLIFRAVVE